MSARNKARGRELENEVKQAFADAGVISRRVFGSGAFKNQLGEDFAGDVRLGPYTVECKRKKSGFKFLYDAMAQDDADIVAIRQDRSPRLYVLREDTLIDLFVKAGLSTEGESDETN
mgnify:FL=1|tara:strand:- start:1611 stop:1961 length:351 start_codon:yes stop_codon:yes gene_type:complete